MLFWAIVYLAKLMMAVPDVLERLLLFGNVCALGGADECSVWSCYEEAGM